VLALIPFAHAAEDGDGDCPPILRAGALGVFALTEPELREELDSIDLEDEAAVADAGRRVRVFLEQIRRD